MATSIKETRLQSFKEYALITAVFFGILVPIRLVFFNFVEDNWFGSLGVLSAVTVSLIYLAKKDRLGKFGKILLKRLKRIHKGRKKYFIYTSTGFFIYLWVAILTGLSEGNTTYKATTDMLKAEMEQPEMQEKIKQNQEKISVITVLAMFPLIISMPVWNFEAWSIVISLVNDQLHQFLGHFAVISLVESLEGVGILMYTRFKSF